MHSIIANIDHFTTPNHSTFAGRVGQGYRVLFPRMFLRSRNQTIDLVQFDFLLRKRKGEVARYGESGQVRGVEFEIRVESRFARGEKVLEQERC